MEGPLNFYNHFRWFLHRHHFRLTWSWYCENIVFDIFHTLYIPLLLCIRFVLYPPARRAVANCKSFNLNLCIYIFLSIVNFLVRSFSQRPNKVNKWFPHSHSLFLILHSCIVLLKIDYVYPVLLGRYFLFTDFLFLTSYRYYYYV